MAHQTVQIMKFNFEELLPRGTFLRSPHLIIYTDIMKLSYAGNLHLKHPLGSLFIG